jgi:hypothetical protein
MDAPPFALNDRVPQRQQTAPAYWTWQDGKSVQVTPYAFLHPCRYPGCTAEGCYGVGVNLRRRKPGVWFCWRHRHMADELAREVPTDIQQAGLDW